MRYLTILLAIIGAILASTLGALFFVALWPYMDIIGKMLTGLLFVVIGCAGFLTLVATWHYAGIIAARRRREDLHSRLITSDGVVVLTNTDGSFLHLSAQHEAAKVKMIPEKVTVKEEEPEAEDETILELHGKGMGLRDIAKALNTTYYRVQKVTANR